MRSFFAPFVLVSAVLMLGCSSEVQVLEVRDACNTFVSEFSPRQTPEIRERADGVELIVSFTPAKNSEASAIHDAAEDGPVDLIVYPSRKRLHSVGLEGHHLVLLVSSKVDAVETLRSLCFEP